MLVNIYWDNIWDKLLDGDKCFYISWYNNEIHIMTVHYAAEML
jgi:hypothetical protein